jgi:hypothetical protein
MSDLSVFDVFSVAKELADDLPGLKVDVDPCGGPDLTFCFSLASYRKQVVAEQWKLERARTPKDELRKVLRAAKREFEVEILTRVAEMDE